MWFSHRVGVYFAVVMLTTYFFSEKFPEGNVFLNPDSGWLSWKCALETNPEKQRSIPVLWYLWKLVGHYLPCNFFATFGIYNLGKRNIKQIIKPEVMMLSWIFAFILIMSIANEKKVWYIMPVFPAFAFVSGGVLDTLLKSDAGRLSFLRVSAGILFSTVFIFVTTLVCIDTNRYKHPDLKATA